MTTKEKPQAKYRSNSADVNFWRYYEELEGWEGDLFRCLNEKIATFLKKSRIKWSRDKTLMLFFDCLETLKTHVHRIKKVGNHIIKMDDYNPLRSINGHSHNYWLNFDPTGNCIERYDRLTRTWTVLSMAPLRITDRRHWYNEPTNAWTDEKLPQDTMVFAVLTLEEVRNVVRQKIGLLSFAIGSITEDTMRLRKRILKLHGELKKKTSQLVSVQRLIAKGEGPQLEFKETLEFSVKTNQRDSSVLVASLKTIAAFLNTKGGMLLIGVNDVGQVNGLERDYKLCNKHDKDGFEQKLRSLFAAHFEHPPLGNVEVRFEQLPDGEVCVVTVRALKAPDVVHLNKEVYIRDGNITRKLSGPTLTKWITQRVKG